MDFQLQMISNCVVCSFPSRQLWDNQAAVSFQKNMTPDSKLRGIFDMRQGWLKELHDRKKFIAVKVATEDNLVDNLTKPLDGKTRKRLDGQLEAIKQRVLRSFRGQVSS